MEHFAAVKILHDIKNRMVYNLYTEFFRFMGIYIGEGIADEYTIEEVQEDLKCFQFILYIAESEFETTDDTFDESDLIYINPRDYTGLTFTNIQFESICEKMKTIFDTLRIRAEQREVEFPTSECIEGLLDIYLSTDILKGSYHLQYYRLENPIHGETETIFKNALEQFGNKEFGKNAMDSFSEPRFIRYAKLYCKQKINLACFYQQDKVFVYSIKELAEECKNLITDYPEFSNVWVLLGMIYEKSHDDIKNAIDAYYTAIEKVGDCCYSSHIFYWIGNLYEKYTSCHEDAKFAYQRAYNHKKKYRNIYKMAKMAEYEEDYEVELYYYKECLYTLDQYREILLDPLEMEYYYKTGVLACFKYINVFRKYEEGIQLGLKMQVFYDTIIENGRYFSDLFEDAASKYQKISMSRISLRKLYECLAIAYREIGKFDESQRYWEESEKY